MPRTGLDKGANTALTGPGVTVTVTAGGVAVDVSALLVNEDGKVRSDDDLVFFNSPHRDGVTLAGTAITAELTAIPGDVRSVVVVASVDVELPGTTFDPASTPSVVIRDGAAELEFVPPGMSGGETVLVLAELYRRGDGWKVRAVGQGYAGGLGALARDFGVSVADDEPAEAPMVVPVVEAPLAVPVVEAPAPMAPPVPSVPAGPGESAIGFEKVAAVAPALLTKYRSAGDSLRKRGLTGTRAAVYLVLDYSGSMEQHYDNGDVQAFSEQILSLAAHLDDDGTIPVVLFHHRVAHTAELALSSYQGGIDRIRDGVEMGGTEYAPAMQAVIELHERRAPGTPALVVFQTDGNPWDAKATRRTLRSAAKSPLFWQFVGFGNRRSLGFLAGLDDLGRRTVDNSDFLAAGEDPRAWSDEDLYDALLAEWPRWLSEARAKGILR
ncbi:VWA domain-containing protein [Kitasatospora sp. NPDC004240]